MKDSEKLFAFLDRVGLQLSEEMKTKLAFHIENREEPGKYTQRLKTQEDFMSILRTNDTSQSNDNNFIGKNNSLYKIPEETTISSSNQYLMGYEVDILMCKGNENI
jgi:hypothetical protein